jgi:hypothetical protein
MERVSNYGRLKVHIAVIFWPQDGPRYRSCHLRGQKKSWAPRKVAILCKGPFRILEMAPFSDFQGFIS